MYASFSWATSPLFYQSLLSYAAYGVGASFGCVASTAATGDIGCRRKYGVRFDPVTLEVDTTATTSLRQLPLQATDPGRNGAASETL